MKAKRKPKPIYAEKPKGNPFLKRAIKHFVKVSPRQQELMNVFGFTQSDLETNREGRLTKFQAQKVMKRESNRWKVPMFAGLFIVLLPMICLISPVFILSLPVRSNGLVPLTLLFSPIVFAGLVFFRQGFFRRQHIKSDINLGRVEAVQGIAIVDISDRNHTPKLTIQNHHFAVSRNALLRIKHLEPHIVYFLPRSKIIVSVEVVES